MSEFLRTETRPELYSAKVHWKTRWAICGVKLRCCILYESNHLTDVVVTQKLCSRLFSRLFILKLFDTVRKHCFYYLVLRPPCRCFATLGRCASLNVRFFECVKLSNTNGLLAVNLGVKRRAVIGSMPLRRFLLAATPTCLCPVSSSMVISLSNIFTLL